MRDLSGVFKAYDIRGVVGEQLDTDLVRDIGAAFARQVGGASGQGLRFRRPLVDDRGILDVDRSRARRAQWSM